MDLRPATRRTVTARQATSAGRLLQGEPRTTVRRSTTEPAAATPTAAKPTAAKPTAAERPGWPPAAPGRTASALAGGRGAGRHGRTGPIMAGLAVLAALAGLAGVAGCGPRTATPGFAPPGTPQLHSGWTSCAAELLGTQQPGSGTSSGAGSGAGAGTSAGTSAGAGANPGGSAPAGVGGGADRPPAWMPDDSALRLPRLTSEGPADWSAVGVVVCTPAERADAGGGEARFLDEMRGTEVDGLVRALRLPDEPRTDAACTLELPGVPWFALLGADGSWLRPGLPADACGKIRIEVRDALQQLRLERTASSRLGTTLSAGAAASGCVQVYSDMVATELANRQPGTGDGTSGGTGNPAAPPKVELPPVAAEVRLCVYRVPAAEQGTAKPAGEFERGTVLPAAAWTAVRAALPQPASPSPCTAHASRFAMLTPTGTPTMDTFIELDGCRRVLYAPSAGGAILAQASPDLVRLLSQP